jgi:hypothetical protein
VEAAYTAQKLNKTALKEDIAKKPKRGRPAGGGRLVMPARLARKAGGDMVEREPEEISR